GRGGRVRGGSDPPHARGHDPRHPAAGRSGEPRGGCHGEICGTVDRDTRGKRSMMPFTKIEQAIAAIGRGDLVIVVDDADRENEGDLIMAAEKVTPEAMGFMIRHTSGVICMPVEGPRLDELRIP